MGPVGPAAGLLVSGIVSWTARAKGWKICARGLAKWCITSRLRPTAEFNLFLATGVVRAGDGGLLGLLGDGE